MSRLGILITGAAVETTISLTWVPQSIFYVAGTQLTSLLVESIDSGTVINLDTAGLNAFGNAGHVDRVTDGYLIPLANGYLPNTKCDIVIVNSAAQTPIIFGPTTGRPPDGLPMWIQGVQQQALADSGISLSKFSRAYFPNAAAADIFNVTFEDGLTYKTTREELQAILGVTNALANGVSDYLIDNTSQIIKMLQFIPAATQTIYIQRLQAVGGDIVLNQEV